jgi:RNA polymerase sigma-70 factor (ECF subfamily)
VIEPYAPAPALKGQAASEGGPSVTQGVIGSAGVSADAADRALVAAVAEGDAAAHARLFRAYHGRLAAFARRVTGRPDTAEEVASDALMVLWRNAGAYEGRARVSTWLHGVAWRLAMRARARAAARPETDAIDPEAAVDPAPRAEDDDVLLRRRLGEALAALSPEHRRVIELTYFEGLACEEAAARLGCPVGTVKTRMMHARARLRRLLEAPPVARPDDRPPDRPAAGGRP